VWDLATKSLLSTFHLPSPLQHLILDPTERAFFAASNLPTGEVYQFNLFQPRKNPLGHEDQDMEIEAMGGHGRGDVIRVEVDSDAARRKRIFEPNAPVTSLGLSLTSSNLLIGTSTGKIMVFDVASHQLLRTFSPSSSASAAAAGGASPFSVTHIHTCLRPGDLVGHVALSTTAGKERDWMPVTRHVAPFQRTRDLKAREAREVWMRLPDTSPTSEHIEYEEDELLVDLASFRSPVSSSAAGNDVQGGEGVTSERVRQLEEEVERLKGQLIKARGVNERMWEAVVKKVVKDGETETPQAHGEVEERARKKGRK
jgi:pre-rRNA-processing protein IPI3